MHRGSDVCVGNAGGVADFNRQAWFAREILVHEPPLRGYLRRFLRASNDVADVIQETYARLLSLPDEDLAQIRFPYAFLFTAARRVAFEWARKDHTVSRDVMAATGSRSVLDDSPSAYEELSSLQEAALLAGAIASLPERCRQVLTLRKIHGLPQREIARRLGIAEHTVERHVANGVRQCADYLCARESKHGAPGALGAVRSSNVLDGTRGSR
jgi:RNA polymerase sigma factor (sigma-70 family)